MSQIEIHKLMPATAASALRARDGNQAAPHKSSTSESHSPAPQSGVSVQLSGTSFAGEPPVDATRVSEIRDALRDGTYPIVPTKIADALIAARLMLGHSN